MSSNIFINIFIGLLVVGLLALLGYFAYTYLSPDEPVVVGLPDASEDFLAPPSDTPEPSGYLPAPAPAPEPSSSLPAPADLPSSLAESAIAPAPTPAPKLLDFSKITDPFNIMWKYAGQNYCFNTSNTANGAPINLALCNNGPDQTWRYDPSTQMVWNPNKPVPNYTGTRNDDSPMGYYCLDDGGNVSDRGPSLASWPCDPANKNMKWNFTKENELFKVNNPLKDNRCLDANNSPDRKPHIWSCLPDDSEYISNQRFSIMNT